MPFKQYYRHLEPCFLFRWRQRFCDGGCSRRHTALPGEIPLGLSDAYAEAWDHQWRAFLGRERMAAAPQALPVVIADLRRFLLPLAQAIDGDWRWGPKVGWVGPTPSIGEDS